MVLRAATARRWTAEELKQRLAAAPSYEYASPSPEQLAELRRGYTAITGDSISEVFRRPPRKLNLLAACYRVHGDETLCFITDEFKATRTAVNLLGRVRCSDPNVHQQKYHDQQPGRVADAGASPDVRSVDEPRTLVDRKDPFGYIMPIRVNGGRGVPISCADYRAHQLGHRRVDSGFMCPVCEAVAR